MYSPKPGNWLLQHVYLKINTGCHARENPYEEAISESSQIRELHETIKLLNERITFNDASAKTFVFKPRYYTKQTSARETFNIWQKPGLFVLYGILTLTKLKYLMSWDHRQITFLTLNGFCPLRVSPPPHPPPLPNGQYQAGWNTNQN